MSATAGERSSPSSGRRSIGRLLSSGGKMALVGVLASAATVGFTLWIQYMMVRQHKVGEPLMRSSMVLERALERTFVALGGWVAYGDDEAKAERARVWKEDILPNLDALKSAADLLDSPTVANDVAELEGKLRQLKYLQWCVEDVARSASNSPPQTVYQYQLRPIRDQAVMFLKMVTELHSTTSEVASDTRRLLVRFLELDQRLHDLTQERTGVPPSEPVEMALETSRLADRLIEKWNRSTEPAAEALVAGANEVRAYDAVVPVVVDLRTGDEWNVAYHLYQTQLQPLQQEVQTIAGRISGDQFSFVRAQAKGLAGWSFVVLGLALLLGGLSIASLYVNLRLEHRVQRALAKAKSLGQYIIDERVGGGGMGDVFRAHHALLRRPSAIKVLKLESALDSREQARFQDEVQTTSLLTHPNTIAIFDYGRTPDGMFYYAMELLDGVTLQTLVEVTGPLPAGRVAHILRQICGSIEEAHAKGLLHRDIKPSNIMLAELGGVFDRVKVLDFGLVARVVDTTATEVDKDKIVGTPAYLAPETIVSESNASPRSDIYAIGAVGYFLLTGTSVFPDSSVSEVLQRHLRELPERPSQRIAAEVPEDLELLILGCLAKEPADRPRTAATLDAMLSEAAIGAWSDEDAKIWWEDYGEALRAASRAKQGPSGATRSHIGARSAVEMSRGTGT